MRFFSAEFVHGLVILVLALSMAFVNLFRYFVAEPDCFLQAHDGPVYDAKFYGDSEDALLLRYNHFDLQFGVFRKMCEITEKQARSAWQNCTILCHVFFV